MRTRFRSEDDDWNADGRKITDPETLEAVRNVLEEEGPIIVEQWLYRGSSSPNRFIFEDYDDFLEYLNSTTSAGDDIHIWSFWTVCAKATRLASGKCPDENGLVPRRGAY